ncbi:hypothetical protein DPX16_8996 [Anabarilius grahami]|uniref:Uncharacterized protein n=1 Tax=Anabarilius grahami TaxID=495550 RepID=A0A3N0XCS0_ANAGA|nr:hypothetical protein DPX16_8996 [Anabarilius grahami]
MLSLKYTEVSYSTLTTSWLDDPVKECEIMGVVIFTSTAEGISPTGAEIMFLNVSRFMNPLSHSGVCVMVWIVVWSPGVSVPCCSCLCVSLDWTSSRCFLVLVFLIGLLSGFHSRTTSRTHGLCSPITTYQGSSPPIEVPVLPLSC